MFKKFFTSANLRIHSFSSNLNLEQKFHVVLILGIFYACVSYTEYFVVSIYVFYFVFHILLTRGDVESFFNIKCVLRCHFSQLMTVTSWTKSLLERIMITINCFSIDLLLYNFRIQIT